MTGRFIVIIDNLAYYIDQGGHDYKPQIYTDVDIAKDVAAAAAEANGYQAAVVYDISGDEMVFVAGFGDGYED